MYSYIDDPNHGASPGAIGELSSGSSYGASFKTAAVAEAASSAENVDVRLRALEVRVQRLLDEMRATAAETGGKAQEGAYSWLLCGIPVVAVLLLLFCRESAKGGSVAHFPPERMQTMLAYPHPAPQVYVTNPAFPPPSFLP